MSSSSQTVICEEIFDESSHPSAAEIRDYASKIGIDPDSEPQLLQLAAEGLMKPLPTSWKPCYDDKRKSYYYHNYVTGKTQWEHPLDDIYRGMVVRARTESQSLSFGEPTEDATYTRDDLPSYEESPPPPPPPLTQFSSTRRDIKLSPLKLRPKIGDTSPNNNKPNQNPEEFSNKLIKQKSEERPSSAVANTHPRKINLSLFGSFDEKNQKLNAATTKKADEGQELTLSGGGMMFLKTNTKKQPAVSPVGSKLEPPLQNQLRSILRENSKGNDVDKLGEREQREEDDKKSVRFNVETTTDFSFDSSSSSSDENDGENREETNRTNNVIDVKIVNTRFTVTPVQSKTTNRSLKLVKPDPTDFIKPELKDHVEPKEDLLIIATDSEEESEKKSDEQKRRLEEMEKLLVSEKTKQEETIKRELENLRKEMESRLSGTLKEEKSRLESDLADQKAKLQEHYETEKKKWELTLIEKFDKEKVELGKVHREKLTQMERDMDEKLEKTRDELIVSHNAILDQIKQNHSAIIDEFQRDFKAKEDIIRREHQKQISELKSKTVREIDLERTRTKDADEERLYEKVRCEKRLLEDKYRCLKDKYLKLKTEVKLSIEKRNRKREQNLNTTTTTTTTTGSETERSPSGKKDRTSSRSPSANRKSSPRHTRSTHHVDPLSKHKIRQIIIQDQDTSASDRSYKNDNRDNDSSDLDANPGKSRKKLFSRLRNSSASRINNNYTAKSKESQRSCSPVENLRKQLQKLEDLEDQFPQNAQGDTYHLRYPFSDGQKYEGSSEMEFFRHRIHLERDSIRRAKESLRKQRSSFKQRQKELKLKHGPNARQTLKQLCQEEKELTDMEVSLHRTRSLLGEKVIRLRHLEQSLQRATSTGDQQKQDDATLSDLSSHSASSGISSTEFVAGDYPVAMGTRSAQFKESSEIMQSLENLNSEIREIWDVLNKQQQSSNIATVLPPLPLLYPDLGWPLLSGAAPVPPSIPTLADRLQNYRQHVALASAQSTMVTHDTQGATTTLVEKTRNLRQWLKQNTVDATVDGNVPQATL